MNIFVRHVLNGPRYGERVKTCDAGQITFLPETFTHFKVKIIEALPVSQVFSENCLRSWEGRDFEDHKVLQKCEERLLWKGWGQGWRWDKPRTFNSWSLSPSGLKVGSHPVWEGGTCEHSAPLSVISTPRQDLHSV